MKEGHQRIPAYFSTSIFDIDPTQNLDLQSIATDLSKQLDDFNRRGSAFQLQRITKYVHCTYKYRLLHGFSYLETPEWLENKRAVRLVRPSSSMSLCT